MLPGVFGLRDSTKQSKKSFFSTQGKFSVFNKSLKKKIVYVNSDSH